MSNDFEVPGELETLQGEISQLIHETISAIPTDVEDDEYTNILSTLSDNIIAHIVLVDPIRIGASVQVPANVIHARTMHLVADAYLKDNDSEYKG